MRPPNIFEVLLLGRSPDCGMDTQGCEGAQKGYFLFITFFLLSCLSLVMTLSRKKAKKISARQAWFGIVMAGTVALLSGGGMVYAAVDLQSSLSTEEDIRQYQQCLDDPTMTVLGETVQVACEY